MRDCLSAGHRLAVLVRPTKRASCRQRIETILARWEEETHSALPRPVVIEGELGDLDLGLDHRSLEWIGHHCTSVIHNAASLTFQGPDRSGEPWRSNVNGTQRVLELCRLTGIRNFHYVSTAYVAGLRKGRVLEDELDVGQAPGNDYEASKIEAEQMVKAAAWLDRPTIYRPSIIVGDSQTGWTSTYHGFYALLKLAHTLVSRLVLGATAGRQLLAGLSLKGEERKNFVPVDWVSAVFCHIFSSPQHHGRTYHLVSDDPPTVGLTADVIQEAVETYSQLTDESDCFRCDGSWFVENFRDQMDIYRSYWRDDPQFDSTNRQAAAGHIVCPPVDKTLLLNLSRYAIHSQFGKARVRPVRLEFDVHEHMLRLAKGSQLLADVRGRHNLGLDVHGPGGGQWKLRLRDGLLLTAEDGLDPSCSAIFRLDAGTFQRMATRKLTANDAVGSGRVAIEGNGLAPGQLTAVLQAAAHAPSRSVEPSA